MNTRIYKGWVQHERYYPKEHIFRYQIFMMYLDLEELQLLDNHWLWSSRGPNVAWFRRRDHLGDPEISLDEAVRQLAEDEIGRRPTGHIGLLTHLRYFGYCMNPVSFYYCWGQDGLSLDVIVAEVNNTPWGERHCYVLDCKQAKCVNGRWRFAFRKAFHVSPFMGMEQDYAWCFNQPGRLLTVHMENVEERRHMFSATMAMKSETISSVTLAKALLNHPFMTGKVVGSIYWQALRLWLKRTPFYNHPKQLLELRQDPK